LVVCGHVSEGGLDRLKRIGAKNLVVFRLRDGGRGLYQQAMEQAAIEVLLAKFSLRLAEGVEVSRSF
jgi:hypothetical protein